MFTLCFFFSFHNLGLDCVKIENKRPGYSASLLLLPSVVGSLNMRSTLWFENTRIHNVTGHLHANTIESVLCPKAIFGIFAMISHDIQNIFHGLILQQQARHNRLIPLCTHSTLLYGTRWQEKDVGDVSNLVKRLLFFIFGRRPLPIQH